MWLYKLFPLLCERERAAATPVRSLWKQHVVLFPSMYRRITNIQHDYKRWLDSFQWRFHCLELSQKERKWVVSQPAVGLAYWTIVWQLFHCHSSCRSIFSERMSLSETVCGSKPHSDKELCLLHISISPHTPSWFAAPHSYLISRFCTAQAALKESALNCSRYFLYCI